MRMSFYHELKRRNVFRVGAAYIVAAWLLIQVAETIFPLFGFGDAPARITVILLAIGFPLFLLFSWVFELTPEGLKKEKDIDRTVSVTRKTGKQLDRVIILLLALGLGYFAFDKFVLDPARDAVLVEETAQQTRSDVLVESYGDKSIAVLPFVNMSDDARNEYFSDGISEELLNLLAQIPELRVISRSSSFSFKGKDIAIPEVAKQLNVAHVLEGSVRKAGNRVRITAQLIDGRSDTHLWSDTYDRELDDIFAVQDEIAAAISVALKIKLKLVAGEMMQPEAIKTANTDAYVAYLQGRELIRGRGWVNMEGAIRHLERALSLDNNFAPAHAQLAIAMILYHGFSHEEARQTAIAHLDRAQELAPDLAEAHAGRALLALPIDAESAVEHARKALAVNPNYIDAMNWLGNGLARLGRDQEAEVIRKQMLVTDPLSVIARLHNLADLQNRGRTEEAHELADQLLEQNLVSGYTAHADTSIWSEGKIAEGLSWALRASPDSNNVMTAFASVGEYDEARRTKDRMSYYVDIGEKRWGEAIKAAQINMQHYPDSGAYVAAAAEVLYYAGRFDEALALYERSLEYVPEGEPMLVPGWYSLANTVRLALVRRIDGDEEGAQAAAQIARQEHAAHRTAGAINPQQDVVEAMIAAFEHDPDHVITALTSAIQRGFWFMGIIDEAIFENMRSDPRFVALRQELEAKLAAEHDKVLQLVCFNNPVPDDWQPLPETCEGVEEQLGL
jgi:TolB-like protein/Flp pilus assembly protein TadD